MSLIKDVKEWNNFFSNFGKKRNNFETRKFWGKKRNRLVARECKRGGWTLSLKGALSYEGVLKWRGRP
jgi:hypothetical protein